MAAFQTYNKKHPINSTNMSPKTSTSKVRHCNNHLIYSERKHENFQSTKKLSVNADILGRSSC